MICKVISVLVRAGQRNEEKLEPAYQIFRLNDSICKQLAMLNVLSKGSRQVVQVLLGCCRSGMMALNCLPLKPYTLKDVVVQTLTTFAKSSLQNRYALFFISYYV